MPIARRFHALGFRVLATEGTARYLRARGIPTERVLKVYEGRPNAIDLLVSGQIQLLINTPWASSPSRTTTPSAGRRSSTGCRTPRRYPQLQPPATQSSR